jgi:hypothetical protein
MDIDVFSSKELDTVFRVLRTALDPNASTLNERERLFLSTYARITGYALPAHDPLRILVQDVHIEGAHQRKRLLQLSAMAALLSNPVKSEAVDFLKALSRQLVVKDSVVQVVEAVRQGKHVKARLISMRRAMRVMFKEAWLAEGPMGMVRLFGAMAFKAAVNKDKLWNYKRLGLLPEGTLGREYWKHMTEVGFGFPGDVAGIADSVAYHDIAHVMADHDTTPQGEIQQGSFQGGNRREDGFFFVQFVLLQFHHGIKVTPATGPHTGHYDPEKVLWAIHRGAKCNVDMTHQWNFWPLMSLTIEEARSRCNLLPKLA